MRDNSPNDNDRLNIESKPLRKNFYKIIAIMIIAGVMALIGIVATLIINDNKND